jgi:hypothetical protein
MVQTRRAAQEAEPGPSGRDTVPLQNAKGKRKRSLVDPDTPELVIQQDVGKGRKDTKPESVSGRPEEFRGKRIPNSLYVDILVYLLSEHVFFDIYSIRISGIGLRIFCTVRILCCESP